MIEVLQALLDEPDSEGYAIGLMVITTRATGASPIFSPLSLIADNYDCLLCDIWGVIHNGVAAFDQAVDALCRYRAMGRHVILITNAPRSSKDIYPQLAHLGVPRTAFDTIITSGDITARLIAKSPELPIFHFGPARDHTILEDIPNPIVGMSDAKMCLLTGPLDDTITAVDVYDSDLVQMRDNAVEMICANPDLVVRSGNRLVICAGSIAQRYLQLGGKVTFAGKPEAEIYDKAMEMAAFLAGRDIPKRRILAIGDGLPTDIKGAAMNGFDAYFIAGGIHAKELANMLSARSVAKAIELIEGQFPSIRLVGLSDRLRWI